MPSFSKVRQHLRIDLVEAAELLLLLGGRVIHEVLVIDLGVLDVRPVVRLGHGQPVAKSFEPPIEHEGRLALLRRDHANDVLVEALRHGVDVDIGDEAPLVFAIGKVLYGFGRCRHNDNSINRAACGLRLQREAASGYWLTRVPSVSRGGESSKTVRARRVFSISTMSPSFCNRSATVI